MNRKCGRSSWTERACWYPFLQFCRSVYTFFGKTCFCVLSKVQKVGRRCVPPFERVFEAELSQCVDSGLACLVRGAVKLVWHPLLFGFFQVTDSPALVVL